MVFYGVTILREALGLKHSSTSSSSSNTFPESSDSRDSREVPNPNFIADTTSESLPKDITKNTMKEISEDSTIAQHGLLANQLSAESKEQIQSESTPTRHSEPFVTEDQNPLLSRSLIPLNARAKIFSTAETVKTIQGFITPHGSSADTSVKIDLNPLPAASLEPPSTAAQSNIDASERIFYVNQQPAIQGLSVSPESLPGITKESILETMAPIQGIAPVPKSLPQVLAVKSGFSQYKNGLIFFHSSEDVMQGCFPASLTDCTWFSYHNIRVKDTVVGMPDPFHEDVARGHALYVTGVSFDTGRAEFEKLFRRCGTVMTSVFLIDMHSKETFRWVIMSSFNEAYTVLKTLNGWRSGSQVLNVARAFAPGKAIALRGRTIGELYSQQHAELMMYDNIYCKAVIECESGILGVGNKFFEDMITFTDQDTYGTTFESSFVGFSPAISNNIHGVITDVAFDLTGKLFEPVKYLTSIGETAIETATEQKVGSSPAASNKFDHNAETSTSSQLEQKAETSTSSQLEQKAETSTSSKLEQKKKKTKKKTKTSGAISEKSNIIVPVSSQTAAPPLAVIAKPAIAPLALSPVAPVTAATTSWANIAAPAGNGSSHLMFDLHPENKSSSSVPRARALRRRHVMPNRQSESKEEQKRVIFIFNLPSTVTLEDVSNAISEGPVLNIKIAADSDNGNRYAGVVFQFAQDAKVFYQALLQERENSKPGRFRFIVDAGYGPPYPFDGDLEDMGEPMYASRRLTIVKKGFFFQFSKRQLRSLCEKLVGAEKIQLVWLYNGGNATVVFSDVTSAVVVKTKFDLMAAGKIKGNNRVAFEDLVTTFSRDPCAQELNLVTDIPDLNLG